MVFRSRFDNVPDLDVESTKYSSGNSTYLYHLVHFLSREVSGRLDNFE